MGHRVTPPHQVHPARIDLVPFVVGTANLFDPIRDRFAVAPLLMRACRCGRQQQPY